MTELVVRTGSFESVRAAVQNGAGGVKLRPEGFTPPGVRGLSLQEIGEIIKYCHIRGVKVYITPGELLSDKDKNRFASLAQAVSTAGADALVAESYDAAAIFRRCAPDLPIHGGMGLNIHNLDGVLRAREAGLSRVCLSPLLSREALRYICVSSPIETEIKVQGGGCPAYGASCHMGPFMEGTQCGFCAATCREPYGFGMREDNRRPLSMKEVCLGAHIPELLALDPGALSMDSYTASPEYVALATGYYASAIREVRPLTQVQLDNLKNAFYSQGGTDGHFTGLGTGAGSGLWSPDNMFFAKDPGPAPEPALEAARESYQKAEIQRVRVRFFAAVSPGVPVRLSIEDDEGHMVTVESQKPASAPPPMPEPLPLEPEPLEPDPRLVQAGVALKAENAAMKRAAPISEETPAQAEPLEEETMMEYPEGEGPGDQAHPEAEETPPDQANPEDEETRPETEDTPRPDEASPEEETPHEDEDEAYPGRRRRQSAADSALEAELTTLLYKTRGTPYRCTYARVRVDGGARISPEVVRALRDKALEQISRERSAPPTRITADLPQLPRAQTPAEAGEPALTVSVTRAAQLSKGLADLSPALVCVPLFEVAAGADVLRPFLKSRDIQLAVSLPRIIWDRDRKAVLEALDIANAMGIDQAEIFNPGHAAAAQSRGFRLRAGLDMNIRTGFALEQLRLQGYLSALLSPELDLEKIAAMDKPLQTELLAYGRIPLLTTEACLMVGRTGNCACGNRCDITDERGANYPLLRDAQSCRNVLYSAKKLYLADRPESYKKLGVWGARLHFTTENAVECRMTLQSYRGEKGLVPNDITRGLYFASKGKRPWGEKEWN